MCVCVCERCCRYKEKHYKNRIDLNSAGIRMQTRDTFQLDLVFSFVRHTRSLTRTRMQPKRCVMSIRKPITCHHNPLILLFDG